MNNPNCAIRQPESGVVAVCLRCVCGCLLFGLLASICGQARASDRSLSENAYAILQTHCHGCHGVEFQVEGLDVLNRAHLVADRGPGRSPYLVPGNAAGSKLWQMVADKRMPPAGPLNDGDSEILKRWIQSGAAFPSQTLPRPFLGEEAMLARILAHLRSLNVADRPFVRYFSLTHLWNNPSVSERELRLYRAGVVKLANSLSQKPAVQPIAIDAEATVLCFDFRQLGWDPAHTWHALVARYPYALEPTDRAARQLTREVLAEQRSSALGLCYLRADWFAATASQGSRYHALLKLPSTRQELEKSLGVNTEQNFTSNRLIRGGVSDSGVSSQPRIVERHPLERGMYWQSFDFSPGGQRANPLRFPLGPKMPHGDFSDHAFQHAGGEIIFRLPNGLHAYLLVNEQGQRIDKAPIEIVWDNANSLGSPQVINGISCIGCHRLGMRSFADSVREGVQLFDRSAQDKLESLFPPQATLDRALAEDTRQYLESLERIVGPWLQQGEDADKPIRDFPEPVSALARRYLQDVNSEDLAAELWFRDAAAMRSAIASNRELQMLGLGPLAGDNPAMGKGKRLNRRLLECSDSVESTFQASARALGRFVPFVLPD